MSVSLFPNTSLGFNRPFTSVVKRTLTITNHNSLPVAFKVKTTAPKLYCVRPNSGRVDPGESVDVSVMLQAMKDDPPLSTKCKDKFLIQSTAITPEKEVLPLQDIWSPTEGNEASSVHQQKLRVVYLPAEGQVLEEEEEPLPDLKPIPIREASPPPAASSLGNSHYGTAHPNGHTAHPPIPEFSDNERSVSAQPPSQEPLQAEPEHRAPSPHVDHNATYDELPEEHSQAVGFTSMQSDIPEDRPATPEHVPPPVQAPVVAPVPAPTSSRIPAPAPAVNSQALEVLEAKYNAAQAEIERLRALLAVTPTPQPELRRRTRALSDDGSDSGETAVGTLIMDDNINQEGVPLQVVVIIALGVFITTYLFF